MSQSVTVTSAMYSAPVTVTWSAKERKMNEMSVQLPTLPIPGPYLWFSASQVTVTSEVTVTLTPLVLAHEKLDRAVFDAYGWGAAFSEREGLGEEEILGRLLEENLRRRG